LHSLIVVVDDNVDFEIIATQYKRWN
jgi:hypothetical protein